MAFRRFDPTSRTSHAAISALANWATTVSDQKNVDFTMSAARALAGDFLQRLAIGDGLQGAALAQRPLISIATALANRAVRISRAGITNA
jgi:hypothetical protein